MAQNSSPHYLCDYSAITIADKDAGITEITYSDTVEETPPDSPHKVVPFDFGRGPVPGYYVTSISSRRRHHPRRQRRPGVVSATR